MQGVNDKICAPSFCIRCFTVSHGRSTHRTNMFGLVVVVVIDTQKQ